MQLLDSHCLGSLLVMVKGFKSEASKNVKEEIAFITIDIILINSCTL